MDIVNNYLELDLPAAVQAEAQGLTGCRNTPESENGISAPKRSGMP